VVEFGQSHPEAEKLRDAGYVAFGPGSIEGQALILRGRFLSSSEKG
jgi:hypothetical protein